MECQGSSEGGIRDGRTYGNIGPRVCFTCEQQVLCKYPGPTLLPRIAASVFLFAGVAGVPEAAAAVCQYSFTDNWCVQFFVMSDEEFAKFT